MAFENEGTGTTMLVQPSGMGYNNGFGSMGGDGWWIILLLLCFGNGWGGNGYGNGNSLYPWLNNSNQINDGFRDQMMNSTINGIQSDVNSGFGDVRLGISAVNQNICQTGNGIVNALNNGFNGAEIAANSRQMASMQQLFGLQSQLAQCCCDNRLASAENRYTIATEACATRTADAQNTRDIIDAQSRTGQAILDKLCQLELDGYKRENDNLRQQLNMASLAASQTEQTAQIRASQATTANQLVNELRSCQIPAQPVYGNTPIFSCNNNGCGCGVA